ncbi:hypothetical protein ACGF5M_02885 [Gemmatimonadota bacterium]
MSAAFFRFVTGVEKVLLRISARDVNSHFLKFPAQRLVDDVVDLEAHRSPSGLPAKYSPESISLLKSLSLDVIIRSGDEVQRGPALPFAKHGVLSLHYGDNRIGHSGPAGFWEVRHRHDYTGFAIQQLSDGQAKGHIIRRGYHPTKRTYLLNQRHLFACSTQAFEDLLSAVAESQQLPLSDEHLPLGPHHSAPPLTATLAYAVTTLRLALRDLWLRYVKRTEFRFSVAYSFNEWRSLVSSQAHVVENPRGRYFADPFVIEHNGRQVCFVEDYVYDTRRAHITAIELSERGWKELGIALQEPFHLSFPFVFRYENELYMIPESHEADEIRLYKCRVFPLEWDLHRTLMKGVSAVDTIVFQHADRWWLFTNIDLIHSGDHSHSHSLYAFHGDSPLSDRWTPHSANPLMVDSSAARNGGVIVEGDRVFRVCQSQGFGTYGRSTRVFEVDELSEKTFAAKLVMSRNPDFLAGVLGTHHLHCDGRVTVFDFMTRENPYA